MGIRQQDITATGMTAKKRRTDRATEEDRGVTDRWVRPRRRRLLESW